MEEEDDLNEIPKQFLGYDYDADTNTWNMGFAKGKVKYTPNMQKWVRELEKDG